MPELTIHFTPEQAEILRRDLFRELAGMTESFAGAVDDCLGKDVIGETCRHALDGREIVNRQAGRLDQVGWVYGEKPPGDTLTGDEDWLRAFVEDSLSIAIDRLSESHQFEKQLQVVDFYKDVMKEQGWPLDQPAEERDSELVR
jgi:hypothetical protein